MKKQVESKSESVSFEKLSKKEKKLKEKEKKELKKLSWTRDYLNREESFCNSSIKRGWKEWENFCQQIIVEELQRDLIFWSRSSYQLLDKAQHAVQTIETHRDHSTEQHRRSSENISRLLDYLIGKLIK